jgi:7 transmembrane receptor (rhodopsin family)
MTNYTTIVEHNWNLTVTCQQSTGSAHALQVTSLSPATEPPQGRPGLHPTQIALCVFQFSIVVVCATANMFVLISFVYEKKLRTTFSILIANLAATDFIVAVIPMNFYTINTTLGYWPLGKVLCGLWVVVDYNTVFASTYTLMAISIDRLWSVKWGILYRRHNTKRKAITAVAIIWSADVFLMVNTVNPDV